MSNVNMQNIFSLLILSSLVQRVRCQWDYVTEQEKIEPEQCLISNFSRNQGVPNTMSTTAITDDEKFDDYELKKLFVKKFKLYKHSGSEKYNNESLQIVSPKRKPRGVQYHTPVDCHTCYATGTTKTDEQCYKGKRLPTVKCADAEYCFTELHPEYLRRGCVLPGRVNRTFVCKCPLCNDKPSDESSHYEYTTINDWAYDNSRLAKRLLGMDLICKVCETRGLDAVRDQTCRSGKSAEYMVCPHNHVCYTNIDDEIDFVSRGCVNRPVYNSIFYFCNSTACNRKPFLRPKRRIEKEAIAINIPRTNLKSLSIIEQYRNGSSVIQVTEFTIILLTFSIRHFGEIFGLFRE